MAVWAIPRAHTFRNGIRVVLTGTTNELFRFGAHAVPVKDDLIEYRPVTGDPVLYEAKGTKYVIAQESDTPDFDSYVEVEVQLA